MLTYQQYVLENVFYSRLRECVCVWSSVSLRLRQDTSAETAGPRSRLSLRPNPGSAAAERPGDDPVLLVRRQ